MRKMCLFPLMICLAVALLGSGCQSPPVREPSPPVKKQTVILGTFWSKQWWWGKQVFLPPGPDGLFVKGEQYYQDQTPKSLAKAKHLFEQSAALGNKFASARLGEMYYYGLGVPKSPPLAIKWYSLAAERGLPSAQLQMGDFYASGKKGLRQNAQIAIRWYELAAAQNNVDAILRLGRVYELGSLVGADQTLAIDYYRKAIDLGAPDGKYYLAGVYRIQHRYELAVRLYQEAASAGYADALAELGEMYLTGTGVAQDKAQAVHCFKRAAEAGSAKGAFDLAVLYELGDWFKKDYRNAFYWYRVASDLDYPYAALRLGDFYSQGLGVKVDYVIANYWYEMAAAKDLVQAYVHLADHHFLARGYYYNPTEALSYYLKAAKKRDPYARYMLSAMYLRGIGTNPCVEKSAYWYQKANQTGKNALAKYQVAHLFHLGLGFDKDVREAITWYELSASAGYAVAQNELGELYFKGRDWPQNYPLAMKYFRQAAGQHFPLAQYNIGLMYFNGQGARMNKREALAWFGKAAKSGSEYAQFLIGEMYAEGLGIKQDRVQAYAWMSISADHRFENMEESLAKLLWESKPIEVVQAAALAEKYRARFKNQDLDEDRQQGQAR